MELTPAGKVLYAEALMLMREGTSPVNDAIRREVADRHPGVSIVDIPAHCDIETFNRCAETGSALLSLECWDRVHPEVKTLRLKELYELPYGITYRRDSGEMGEYVRTLEAALG